ncbi:hypothetical protein LguiB_030174 [Lonicera macranthoides]
MLSLRLHDDSENGRAGRLYARLKNEKTVLIILDDVWAIVNLAAVGIPCEESWCLFKENAGEIVDSAALSGVAMEIAKECRGLPLALVTVGRALQDNEIGEWKMALQHLRKSIPMNINEYKQYIFSCIKLSYDHLKSEDDKSSILFCGLFFEDYDIKIEDLASFKMGKGLFRDIDTMEEAITGAFAISKYLKASCLMLENDKEGCMKMHDVVRVLL